MERASSQETDTSGEFETGKWSPFREAAWCQALEVKGSKHKGQAKGRERKEKACIVHWSSCLRRPRALV